MHRKFIVLTVIGHLIVDLVVLAGIKNQTEWSMLQ